MFFSFTLLLSHKLTKSLYCFCTSKIVTYLKSVNLASEIYFYSQYICNYYRFDLARLATREDMTP